MILNAKGQPLTRRLGFVGGIEVEHTPKRGPLVSLIGCDRVWPDEASIETSKVMEPQSSSACSPKRLTKAA
jgi:hypothetical protein